MLAAPRTAQAARRYGEYATVGGRARNAKRNKDGRGGRLCGGGGMQVCWVKRRAAPDMQVIS